MCFSYMQEYREPVCCSNFQLGFKIEQLFFPVRGRVEKVQADLANGHWFLFGHQDSQVRQVRFRVLFSK